VEIFPRQGAAPVSTTPVANLPPKLMTLAAIYHQHQRQILPPVNNTAANFSTGVNDTGGKQCEKNFLQSARKL
jgi:hypothetical protein